MADVFISHASQGLDLEWAKFLDQHLRAHGISVFLAPVSLQPGQHWPSAIQSALAGAQWVLFLASRRACESQWVQQELGGALLTKKQIVPIVWDMDPSKLPGWCRDYQALDVRGKPAEQVRADITAIAERIKSSKALGLLIGGLIVAGLIALGSKGN